MTITIHGFMRISFIKVEEKKDGRRQDKRKELCNGRRKIKTMNVSDIGRLKKGPNRMLDLF